MALRKNPIDFTIGADPEFMSIFNNSVIRSSECVEITDQFGRDAYDKLFELKPFPSLDPCQVSENLSTIMCDAVKENPEFLKWKWVCDSFYKECPMGGHLHAGISSKIIHPKDACSQYLDHYVGAITLLLEDRRKGLARRNYRRKNYRYGFASDFRSKNHGFEYRSPSSWITSPQVSRAILCLFKLVCYEMINNKSFKPRIFVAPSDFETMNVIKLREEFPMIWEDIQKMMLYPQYKGELQLIYDLIIQRRTWLSKFDMKVSWGIIEALDKVPLRMTLDDIWEDFNKLDTDKIIQNIKSSRSEVKKRLRKAPYKRTHNGNVYNGNVLTYFS